MTWIAAACAVGLVLLLIPPVGRRSLARLTQIPPRQRRGGVGGAVAAAALIAAIVTVMGGARVLGWFIVVAVISCTVGGLVWRSLLRRRSDMARKRVARAARVLSGQLRIGQVPSVALADSSRDCVVFAEAAAADRIGGDVVAALRLTASRRGHDGLAELASAWELSARTGAPVADVVDRVAESLQQREVARSGVAVEVAGARTTGRVMAMLPFGGVLLGYAAGGDPITFLTTTAVGELMCVVAACLAASGVWWLEIMADRAAR